MGFHRILSIFSTLKSFKKIFTFQVILCLCLSLRMFAQPPKVDSLKELLSHSKTHDTTKCKLLYNLTEVANEYEWEKYNQELIKLCQEKMKDKSLSSIEVKFYKEYLALGNNNLAFAEEERGNLKIAAKLYEKNLFLFKELNKSQGIATTLNNLAAVYEDLGNLSLANRFYKESILLDSTTGNAGGLAYSYNNYGVFLKNQGAVSQSIKYLEKALKIRESLNNKQEYAITLNNLISVYILQEDYDKAIEFQNKCLLIQTEARDSLGMALSYNNLGVALKRLGKLEEALDNYKKSLQIRQNNNKPELIASSLNNIGSLYSKMNEEKAALNYYYMALQISNSLEELHLSHTTLMNISKSYLHLNKIDSAFHYSKIALTISKELGYPLEIKNTSEALYKIYKIKNDYKNSLLYFEIFVQMRDSIYNESTRKASIKSQLKYEYEKQAAADSVSHAKETEVKNAQLAEQKAEIKAKKNAQYALFGGLALVLVFAGTMYNRFKVAQKQKGIIEEQKLHVEEQKKLVEEKQKEILDSIHYARRIQMAQIPSEGRVLRIINNLLN